jgi:hypothetical protein
MEELKKIYCLELEDPRLVPFIINVVYDVGEGTLLAWYVKVSIVLC